MERNITIDSREIIFIENIPDNVDATNGQDVATWTNDPLLVKMHERLFDYLWSASPKIMIKNG